MLATCRRLLRSRPRYFSDQLTLRRKRCGGLWPAPASRLGFAWRHWYQRAASTALVALLKALRDSFDQATRLAVEMGSTVELASTTMIRCFHRLIEPLLFGQIDVFCSVIVVWYRGVAPAPRNWMLSPGRSGALAWIRSSARFHIYGTG